MISYVRGKLVLCPAERVLARVDHEDHGHATRCWIWTGYTDQHGYGTIKGDERRTRYTHRVVYAALVGEIPEGLKLDHLCRVTACCNPDHLEPVTQRENILRSPTALAAIQARQTHCLRNHPLSGENLFVDNRGKRGCRTCRRMLAKKRAAA